jgi:hypothetical protein
VSAALLWASVLSVPAAANARTPTISIYTDQLAGPPLMGLGVELDPYDSFQPTPLQWNLIFERLDFMKPGFLRVVEPAYDYFAGYDPLHNPRYHWNGGHVKQLLTILSYAKSRGIPVVLGDWGDPIIDGDPRIPAEFLQQLHDVYGFTNIRYYNLTNEPNYQGSCDFACWAGMVRTLSAEFASLGLNSWLALVGPDNANSWDDTAAAQALDRTGGLDTDNPTGGDSWVTRTLQTVPGLIGAYDSHRYATIWGIEHGVYGDQMRARREQISNADSPSKPYFEGEVGMTARQMTPFAVRMLGRSARPALAPLIDPRVAPLVDPSARASAGAFVDSQPHIRQFLYGAWMGDMMTQALSAGVSGASAWDLDDAMHVGGQYGSQNLKQWGFWNSLGGQDGYPPSDVNLRPWYYAWSVLARSFPAGSLPLVTPATGVAGLRVAAAKIPSGSRYALSVAVANDSTSARSITLMVPSARQPITLVRYDYFYSDRPVDATGLPTPVQSVSGVRLARGLTLRLPARGIVVLSSPANSIVPLHEGTQALTDDLGNWSVAASHTKGLKLDHSAPPRFNDDPSRAVVRSKHPQYLIYRAGFITSFELKAYYHGTLGLRAFVSRNGRSWSPIAIESTNAAPSLGGHGWYLDELLPGAPIPLGAKQLMIELSSRQTELSQVNIEYR